MNLLIDRLPTTVEICGKEVPIRADWRVSVLYTITMESPELSAIEKLAAGLDLYLLEPPEDAIEAARQIMWFYRCGKQECTGAGAASAPAFSFSADDWAVYSAFRQQYGIDLQAEPGFRYLYTADGDICGKKGLHWWEFYAMLRAVEQNTRLSEIIGYRSAKIPANMPPEQKAFYRSMKQKYAIKKEKSKELIALEDALENGLDITGLL